MVNILVITFIVTSMLSLFPYELHQKFKKGENIIFYLLGLLLFIIAGFRSKGIDRDYLSYVNWFENARDNVELSFQIISDTIKKLGGDSIYLFILYALLGISTKFFAIKKMSAFPLLSILVYIGYLYPLQELTQIRAGVATGFILLSIYQKINQKILYSIFFMGCAIFFHYSSLIVIPILFFNPNNFNKLFYSAAIILSYWGSIYLSAIIESVMDYLPAIIKWKIMAYGRETGAELNIFNGWQLLRVGVAFFMIFNIDQLSKFNSSYQFLLKIYVIGIFSYTLFSFNPVFAVRISDLFFVVDLILLPALCHLFPVKCLPKIIVITICALFLFLQVSYIGIFSN